MPPCPCYPSSLTLCIMHSSHNPSYHPYSSTSTTTTLVSLSIVHGTALWLLACLFAYLLPSRRPTVFLLSHPTLTSSPPPPPPSSLHYCVLHGASSRNGVGNEASPREKYIYKNVLYIFLHIISRGLIDSD